MKTRVTQWGRAFPFIIWLLGFGSLVNIAGLSLLWPVNAIYIHSVLGKPMTIAGLVLMFYSGAGFVGSALGGWLFDRIGAVSVLALGLFLSGVTVLAPVFWPGWVVYVTVLMVFGTTSSMAFPVLSALAGKLWPAGGRRAFNFLYVSNNLGVAAGTAIGGVLAQWSFRSVFIGIALANGAFLAMVLLAIAPALRAAGDKAQASVSELVAAGKRGDLPLEPDLTLSSPWTVVPWGAIVIVLIGFVAGWSVYVQWQSSISVYMQSLGFPLTAYSVLWTLNGLLIFAAQPLVTFVTSRMTSLGLQMLTGIVMYALAFGILIVSHRYGAFVLAMVVTTLGEVFVWPSVPAFVAKVSPANRIGLLQGMVQSGATLGRMLGPLFGGLLYDHAGVHALLCLSLPVLIVPGLCFLWIWKIELPRLPSDTNFNL